MKKTLGLLFFIALFLPSVFSEKGIEPEVYQKLTESIVRVEAPKIKDGYIIFTSSAKRHIGIAFSHEDYKRIHSFKKLNRSEFEKTIFFYIFPIPDELTEIRYRLVIDGLWSPDPINQNTAFDNLHSMSVSCINVPYKKEYKTGISNKNAVKFTYLGEAKKNIKLAGSFNNWDPFMYDLIEVSPGRYELNLNLPSGTWLYAYFSGGTRLPDTTNKNYVYTVDGRVASVITVK
ncbi:MULTISPECIES: isoamylase [unclassified Treponema]|uniref:isoamylase n=1 Tax=unclassified Treponema TaxID=2638727 RepID=UPI0020A33C0E|nr:MULTISPECIES: isoamylase [unclassified Treponema]UTC66499.1 isoamylase [Treponema sp. OMZ 789]UTC69231.1 isoamylase [Treponema sp. OMZ 790]UTC71944.1 isoamylase [Treponema sp. OMZ 791]